MASLPTLQDTVNGRRTASSSLLSRPSCSRPCCPVLRQWVPCLPLQPATRPILIGDMRKLLLACLHLIMATTCRQERHHLTLRMPILDTLLIHIPTILRTDTLLILMHLLPLTITMVTILAMPMPLHPDMPRPRLLLSLPGPCSPSQSLFKKNLGLSSGNVALRTSRPRTLLPLLLLLLQSLRALARPRPRKRAMKSPWKTL